MLKITVVALAALTLFGPTAFAGSGAIAFSLGSDEKPGVYFGTSNGSYSRQDAQRWAIYDCEKHGGKDCRVIVSETEACAALAVGDKNKMGWSWSPMALTRPGNAKDQALQSCSELTSDCEVVAWVCH